MYQNNHCVTLIVGRSKSRILEIAMIWESFGWSEGIHHVLWKTLLETELLIKMLDLNLTVYF